MKERAPGLACPSAWVLWSGMEEGFCRERSRQRDHLYRLYSACDGTARHREVFVKGLKVLIVDDEPLMRLSMLDALEGIGCEVMAAATGTEGLTILGTRQFDIVITDLRLPGADGLTILKACKERSPTTEVILITAHGSVDTAVGAIKLGAYDYITKPFQMDELLLIVERVGKILGLRRENLELKEVLEDRFSFGGILGCNHQMRALLEKIS